MPHQSGHVIVSALKTPVKGKLKVWHYVAALCLVVYVVGYCVGKF